jgi:ABC-2 type transport system ATP-binding protein
MVAEAAIAADGLVKRFGTGPAAVEALRGISFEVGTGTVLGLLGPNGAGKTTAVRILTTLMRPDAGSATVLGIDVAAEPALIRAMIGLAGQYAAVDDNLTARENLRLVGRLTHIPAGEIAGRGDELLERFQLADAADRLVRTFSGGMHRRLDLAAALVHRPPVLFLDEPTTGLDPYGRTELWRVIEELVGSGTTLLLTTQYLEEADRLADRIVVIDHGLIIAEGTSAELKGQLGSTVIEVAFKDQESATVAATRLAALGSVDVEGHELRMHVADGASAMLATVRTLDAEHLEPMTMALREPTLDDVFLSLTGHAAEAPSDDDSGDGPAAAARRRGGR